jgi:hypothetical protein
MSTRIVNRRESKDVLRLERFKAGATVEETAENDGTPLLTTHRYIQQLLMMIGILV